MNAIRKRLRALGDFHQDEDGMETMQVVMIVAIAAIVLIAVLAFWGEIKTWVKGVWEKMKGKESGGESW